MNTKMKWRVVSGMMAMLAVVTLTSWADNSSSTNVPAERVIAEDPLKNWISQETARLTKGIPLLEGLELNPQMISATDGKGSTFGLSYKYDRRLVAFPNSLAGDLNLKLHSDGTYLADSKSIPNNVFTHSLKLSWIDILSPKYEPSSEQARKLQKVRAQRLGHAETLWSESTNAAEKDAIFYEAAKEMRDEGKLEAKDDKWYVNGADGKSVSLDTYLQRLEKIVPRAVFLSADIGGSIEHDQRLDNVQYVGDVQLRSKLIYPFFDFPAKLVRKTLGSNKDGDGAILDWLNLAGGPYLWGGVGVVDASQNQARKAVTTEREVFPRANVGAYYRTELYGISESQSVALELNWSFYYEFAAPVAILARHLDVNSYFKATLLLPVVKSGDVFVEYSVGRLPVDLTDGQTVSVGWRYKF